MQPPPAFGAGPPGPEADRAWYAPQPDPDLPPIAPRRAYAEVLFVFGAFFAAGIVLAAVSLGGRTKDLTSNASWALYGANAVQVVFQTALAVVLVWLLAQRRGVSPAALGLRLPRDVRGRVAAGQLTRNLAWAVLALGLGLPLTGLLETGSFPKPQTSAPAMIFSVFESANAGVVEELVVLAFVVVSLRQARRPWWEVTVVALVLRGSYHIYYGVGVVGILVWAAIFYWTYLRTRSLIPLMVTHAVWDAAQFLGQRWPAVAGFTALAALGILIAGPITWLVERNRGPALPWVPAQPAYARPGFAEPTFAPSAPPAAYTPTASAAPARPASVPAAQPTWGSIAGPGWHPDPSGQNQWRWWDGYQWTGYVSAHAAGSQPDTG